MDSNLIKRIKQKKELSGLPDSVIERVAKINGKDIKNSRILLRKYFGVFLTNKILKGKLSDNEMLTAHMSSKKRDYKKFYETVFDGIGNVKSIIDLGCGVNGFSYKYLQKVLGNIDYVGIEATGQIVEHMNKYFGRKNIPAKAFAMDLFDIEGILDILKEQRKNRIVFMFQVIDALENLKMNFSKEFILEISKNCEKIILSFPTRSLSGKKKFMVQRKWLIDFLKRNFVVEKDFELNQERILVFKKRNSK